MRLIWQGTSVRISTFLLQTRRIRKYGFGAPAKTSIPFPSRSRFLCDGSSQSLIFRHSPINWTSGSLGFIACLVFSTGIFEHHDEGMYKSHCDNDPTVSSTATDPNTMNSPKSATVDAYLSSLMEDYQLIKLPYSMGTSNPTLMHLFGVDRAIVEEAVATVESTIEGWNNEVGTIVGHPIVYVLKDPDDSFVAGETGDDKPKTIPPEQQPTVITVSHGLVHHPEFHVPWSLLEHVADILWDDARIRLGIFPEAIEKKFMVNILNVVSAILTDMLLSMSITMNNGAVQLRWTIDEEKFHQYYDDLAKDPEEFRKLVNETLSRIDFDEVSRQAKEAVQQQQEQQQDDIQQGQEDVLQALYHFIQEKGLPQTSLEHVEVEIYEMTFKLMLILFSWFTLDAEARILGRSITQHFVKPSDAASRAVRTNVLKEKAESL